MAEPAAKPAEVKGKSNNPFKNLTPKQKKIAAAVGIAAVLALFYLLNKRQAAEPEPGQASPSVAGGSGEGPATATGASDPSAYLGEFSGQVQQGLASLGSQVESANANTNETREEIAELFASQAQSEAAGEARDERTAAALAGVGANLNAIKKKLQGKGNAKKPSAAHGGHKKAAHHAANKKGKAAKKGKGKAAKKAAKPKAAKKGKRR